MCTRFVLLKEHLRAALQQLGLPENAGYVSRYNIAPGTPVPAARAAPQRESCALRWGLVPSWAREDVGFKLVNARAETLVEKPAFRDALRRRRCVIPVSGFYEWQTVGRAKKPWLFRWRDEQPFALAGLWESWRAPDGTTLETCAVITVEPNELMRPLHHRMPVMLTPGQFDPWLDPAVAEPEKLRPLLRPPPAAAMSAVALDSYVSNVRHEGPACLAPAGPGAANDEPQFSLGL